MDNLRNGFSERLQEVETYLDFLQQLETTTQTGPPRVGTGAVVTPQQQRILYSVVYLQLYNLVEATITRCIDTFAEMAISGAPEPAVLSEHMRREWVRHVARTHVDLTYENRLNSALTLCRTLLDGAPIQPFKIEKSGGNWDDQQIAAMTTRLGLTLRINPTTVTGVKRPFRNEKGALTFIKTLRNDLAHGTVSFAECGEGTTVDELRQLKDLTSQYLREVVDFFSESIAMRAFWRPEARSAGGRA